MSGHRPTRSEVRHVECTHCGAHAGEPCVEENDAPRIAHHVERVRRYRDGLFGPQPAVTHAMTEAEANE